MSSEHGTAAPELDSHGRPRSPVTTIADRERAEEGSVARQALEVAIWTERGVSIKAQATSAWGVSPVHMYMAVGGAWFSAFVSVEDARTLGQGLVALADALEESIAGAGGVS